MSYSSVHIFCENEYQLLYLYVEIPIIFKFGHQMKCISFSWLKTLTHMITMLICDFRPFLLLVSLFYIFHCHQILMEFHIKPDSEGISVKPMTRTLLVPESVINLQFVERWPNSTFCFIDLDISLFETECAGRRSQTCTPVWSAWRQPWPSTFDF